MKQIKFYSILCFIVAIMYQCGNWLEDSYPLHIRNNHNTDIYYYFNMSSVNDVIYPDTTLSFQKDVLVRVRQKTEFIDNIPLYPIEKWILDLPHDTLSIYIFDIDILNKYSWEEIQRSYRILRRYDLSIEDIHKLHNEYDIPVITYPPTEVMKNMKMYPPYQ